MLVPNNLPPISCLKQAPLNKVRCDKFILTIDIPILLRKKLIEIYKDASIIDSFQVNLTNAPFPVISVPSIAVPYAGQTYNISSHTRPKYEDLDVSFFVDSSFINYWLLWFWLDMLNGVEDSINNVEIMSQTTTSFTLSLLDEYNSTIVNVIYEDVSIVQLGNLTLDYANANQLKASAKFVFNRMLLKYPEI